MLFWARTPTTTVATTAETAETKYFMAEEFGAVSGKSKKGGGGGWMNNEAWESGRACWEASYMTAISPSLR